MRPAIVFLTLAFVVSDLARTVNAVLGTSMRDDLNLTEGAMGGITAAFYVAFIIVQLPLGAILDRFGPKRVQLLLLPIAILGAFLCSNTTEFYFLFLGRLLLGIGLSLSLMAAFKGVKLWVKEDYIPSVNGIVLGVGALGGVLATWPAGYFAELFSWRDVYLLLSAFIFLSWLGILLGVPEASNRRGYHKPLDLKAVIRQPVLWTIGVPSAISVGMASAVQSLWAGLWLSDVAFISEESIKFTLLWMALATICGSLIFGKLASFLSHVDLDSLTISLIIFFILIQIFIVTKYYDSVILWSAFALFGTSGMLTFSSIACKSNSDNVATTNAIFNVMTFMFAIIIQVCVGVVIDLLSAYEDENSYRISFLIMIFLQVIAVLFYFMVKLSFIKKFSYLGSE